MIIQIFYEMPESSRGRGPALVELRLGGTARKVTRPGGTMQWQAAGRATAR